MSLGMSALSFVVLGCGTLASIPVEAQVTATPTEERFVIAKRIAIKMHAAETATFALTKIAPLFSLQVMNQAKSSNANPFAVQMATPESKDRLSTTLANEYVKAFKLHVSEISDAVATQLAGNMSSKDLASTDRFLDTPAGKSWAQATLAAQVESSATGQRIGALAGAEAVAATIKNLEPSASSQ